MNTILLSTAYLPPVSYMAKVAFASNVSIEQFDSYHKQTYRNRCRILAANGALNLTIPVVKNSGVKTLVKDVKIDYATAWQSNHWRSILSAYNSSPFLEYYIDDLYPFYHRRFEFLIDFNTQLLETLCELLDLDTTLDLTSDFCKSGEYCMHDFREEFSPKKFRESNVDEPYTQTFSEKFGFIADLSVVDLLLNVGPLAHNYLLRMNDR
jgi:hypothetical protein